MKTATATSTELREDFMKEITSVLYKEKYGCMEISVGISGLLAVASVIASEIPPHLFVLALHEAAKGQANGYLEDISAKRAARP